MGMGPTLEPYSTICRLRSRLGSWCPQPGVYRKPVHQQVAVYFPNQTQWRRSPFYTPSVHTPGVGIDLVHFAASGAPMGPAPTTASFLPSSGRSPPAAGPGRSRSVESRLGRSVVQKEVTWILQWSMAMYDMRVQNLPLCS